MSTTASDVAATPFTTPAAGLAPMSVREPLGATSDGATVALRDPRSRPREWLAIPGGRVGLAGLLVTGVVISLSASHTELLLPTPLRPLPATLAGVFGRIGLNIGFGGLIVALVLMFLSYALALRASKQLSPRAVLISIAVLNVIVLLAPPLFSTDLFSYVAYGRLGATYGINPYVHGPSAILLDPLYPYIGSQWVNTPTAYGPLFTALSYPIAALSISANVFIYKAVAALSSLVIVGGVWRAARLRGMDPVKAVALVGLNPVILVYGVGGGHNDLLMLAVLVVGMYVLLTDRRRTSGAMIVAAAAIKLTAGVMLPFAVAMSAGRREHSDERKRVLVGAGAAALVFCALGAALFGIGPLHLFATLHTIQAQGGLHSIPGFILTAIGLGRFTAVAGLVLDGVFAVGLVWLLRRVWIGELDWITGAGWATVGLLVTAGLLMPWYIVWLLPLAALSSDRRLWTASILLTGVALTSL
ncbi:MAG: polyprenol phosphomannose-dependent alpha 1,6 mannosyltransferase MptB [Solirubrobacteraceae bacterium]